MGMWVATWPQDTPTIKVFVTGALSASIKFSPVFFTISSENEKQKLTEASSGELAANSSHPGKWAKALSEINNQVLQRTT